MTAPVSVVMRRAAELERQRRQPAWPLKNLAPVQPLPEKPPSDRNPMFEGRCAICGCHTKRPWYCAAHAWVGDA